MNSYAEVKENGEILYLYFALERTRADHIQFAHEPNAIRDYWYDFAKGMFVKRPDGASENYELIDGRWILNIENERVKKSNEINGKCRDAIIAGYDSSALGQELHYPCAEKDQINMMGSVTDSLNPLNDAGWATPFWCADSDGNWEYRMHSKAQIQKAGADGKAHIVAQLSKNAQLQAQIQAATTEEELNSIAW